MVRKEENIMKISEGFVLKEVAGSFVVAPTGAKIVDFSAMITLNETGAFLFKCLGEDITEEELAKKLSEEYDVDFDTALGDVKEYVEILKAKKVLN